MNNFNIAFLDLGDDGLKRIVKDITSDVKIFLDVDDKIPVWVNGSFDEIAEKVNNDNDFTKQPSDKRIEVTFNESIDDDDYNTVLQSMGGLIPVFNDTELKVVLSPIISRSKLTLSIMFYSRSKVFLEKIITKLRLRDSLIRKNFRHKNITTISYIDNRVLILLKELNKYRQLKYPGETLSTYLTKYASARIKQVNSGSVNQKNTILAVYDKYENITGKLITESSGLKINFNKADNRHELEIEYEVYINKPITLNVKYPSMIFNQVINKRFIQKIDPYKDYIETPDYVDPFDKLVPIHPRLKITKSNLYVNIPDFDTYILKDKDMSYKKVFCVLLSMLDENNIPIDSNTPILNLKELGTVKFNDTSLNFLLNEYSYINKLHRSIFNISMYENDRKIDSDTSLVVDSDLNVYFTRPIKLEAIYRLCFKICIDPNIITDEAYKRALEYDMINLLNNVIVVNDKYNYELYRTDKFTFKTVNKDKPILAKTVQVSRIQAAGILEVL